MELINNKKNGLGYDWKLIYRASKDGWLAKDFHNKCDNKDKTLSIIHTKTNNIFGGYTKIPWKTLISSRYIKDDTAFLYLLRSSKSYSPQIFLIKDDPLDQDTAVYHSKDYMCTYGAGHDIKISSECNENATSYVYGSRYKVPRHIAPYYLNGGSEYFKVKELEVFQLQ